MTKSFPSHGPGPKGAGFTLVELLFAAAILATASIMGICGWLRVLRGERLNSAQAELDIQVRTAIERIRAEARLSAAEKMVFHPDGPGPYEAISFPVAFARDDIGLVPMLSETNILWDTTVIYHVDTRSPDRLLRTTFRPRDNGMTTAARREQLARVVAGGSGEGCEGAGETASTRVVFANFFTWKIEPLAGVFDTYAPQLARQPIDFGTAPLGPGAHTFTFAAVGRNTAAAGCKLGIDTLRVSPTGHAREAEDQTVADSSAPIARRYIPGGSWSGHHDLLADPGEAGDLSTTLVLDNDRWEETNFRFCSPDATHHTEARFDAALLDYVVRLTGSGVVWRAGDQTLDPQPTLTPTNISDHAFRVLIRGGDGGVIQQDGRLMPMTHEELGIDWPANRRPSSYLLFRIPGWHRIQDCYATIALAAQHDSPFAARPPFRFLRLYRDGGDNSRWLGLLKATRPEGGADLGPMDIGHTNSYVVTFRIGGHDDIGAQWAAWRNRRDPGGTMSAVATNVGMAAFLARREDTDWTGSPHTTALADICFLEELVTAHVKEGAFVSQVFDTTLANPRYNLIAWDEAKPHGTDIELRARAGDSAAALAALADWSAAGKEPNPGTLSGAGFGRYLQFRARLVSDDTVGATPLLRRVVCGWPGEPRMVDIGGEVTVGPDHGAFQVLVDGQKLVKGLRFELTIFKDVPGGGHPRRLTSAMSMEVEPRNSGR